MNGEKNKVNIYELAEASGFSVSTVSKALNNTGRISEATKKIILDKATEMNYVANYNAKALSQGKSWIIAIIYSDNLGIGLSHPHFSVILESFKQEVEQAGYEVTFVNRNMGKTKMSYLEFCRYRNVEGVYIVNFYSLSYQLPELIKSGIPIVTTDGGNWDITTITSDDFEGGRMATEYLVNLGHDERVYHIAGPLSTVSAQQRLQGFQDIVTKRNIKEHKIIEAENFGFDDGYNAVLKLLQEETLPTAIFVASDLLALGAIKALQDNNFHVPDDVSIIGFDNMEFLKYSRPALTTVSQNKRMIGITSAQYLMEKISGKEKESVMIDVEIIERETCKRIK